MTHTVRTRMTVGRVPILTSVIVAEEDGSTQVNVNREQGESSRQISIATCLLLAHTLSEADSPLEKAIWEAIVIQDGHSPQPVKRVDDQAGRDSILGDVIPF